MVIVYQAKWENDGMWGFIPMYSPTDQVFSFSHVVKTVIKDKG